jgi:hypothetical protein
MHGYRRLSLVNDVMRKVLRMTHGRLRGMLGGVTDKRGEKSGWRQTPEGVWNEVQEDHWG